MNVFQVINTDDAPGIGPVQSGTSQGIAKGYLEFLGVPKREIWQAVDCVFARNRKRNTTFAAFMFQPAMFSQIAEDDLVLQKILLASCELLPLRVEGREALVVHATRLLDCVDEERSKIKYLDDDTWVFLPDKVVIGTICRIKTQPWINIVATDSSLPPEEDFYQWYHKQGYTGLRFKLLWQSA